MSLRVGCGSVTMRGTLLLTVVWSVEEVLALQGLGKLTKAS
jgi:hypothetical protein